MADVVETAAGDARCGAFCKHPEEGTHHFALKLVAVLDTQKHLYKFRIVYIGHNISYRMLEPFFVDKMRHSFLEFLLPVRGYIAEIIFHIQI